MKWGWMMTKYMIIPTRIVNLVYDHGHKLWFKIMWKLCSKFFKIVDNEPKSEWFQRID